MEEKWHGVCLWVLLVVLQGLCWQWGWCYECRESEEVFRQSKFMETHFVTLECSGTNVLSVIIYDTNKSNELVTLVKSLEKQTCTTKEHFASCRLEDNFVSVLVTDLQEGEDREYHCAINEYVDLKTKECDYVINITREAPSATPAALATSPATKTQTPEKLDVADSSTAGESIGVSSTLFIVAVVALVIMIVICCVLGWVFFKQKSRKRKSTGDPDNNSLRSAVTDKSFYYTTQAALGLGQGWRGGTGMEMGVMGGMGGMGTLSHHTHTSPAPSMAAPDVPGGGQRLVMNYQQPFNTLPATNLTLDRKDVRRLSENAVQYQEPWGAITQSRAPPHATSTLTRPPNPYLVKIPDVSTTTPPGEDTDPIAPPTQEIGPASIEDSAFSE